MTASLLVSFRLQHETECLRLKGVGGACLKFEDEANSDVLDKVKDDKAVCDVLVHNQGVDKRVFTGTGGLEVDPKSFWSFGFPVYLCSMRAVLHSCIRGHYDLTVDPMA